MYINIVYKRENKRRLIFIMYIYVYKLDVNLILLLKKFQILNMQIYNI
jgi:hypothetical protein